MPEAINSEYDDEAGMAHSNLLTTARAVMGLLKTIKDRDNLPEWGQEKIAKAEMMLVSVWDYLQSQKEMGNDPQQGVAEGGASMPGDQYLSIPADQTKLSIGQQMARDGITYSPDKEDELIGLMVQYMKKAGMSSKQIRYLLNYDEDFISDQLSDLPRQGVTESQLDELLDPSSVTAKALRYIGRKFAQAFPWLAVGGVGAGLAASGLMAPIVASMGGVTSAIAALSGEAMAYAGATAVIGTPTLIQSIKGLFAADEDSIQAGIKKWVEKQVGDENDVVEFVLVHSKAAYLGQTGFRWRAKEWPVKMTKDQAEAHLEKNDKVWLDGEKTKQDANTTTPDSGLGRTKPVDEALGGGVDAKGRTQQQWAQLVKSKYPTAKIVQAKMIDGPMYATLPDGRTIKWKKVEQGVAEGDRPFRGVGGAFNRGDDERHDLDPTDWYIVKDGKMFKTSVYPNQVQLAIAQGYSRTRDEAKAKASEQGVAEGSEFGAYYYEKVAQEIFNNRKDISSEDEVLNQAWKIVSAERGNKSARYMFNYDEDFPSDLVSAYFWLQKNQSVAEGERTMSRAAKGHEKYGKAGMAALAKAGRDGAGEEKLDKIRDKHDKYNEGVAGPEKCWPGHRKVGTKPGTGKNAGKRVNDCEKIGEQGAEKDSYIQELASKMAEKLDPNADPDVWVQDFQKADPNKYHQFRNKTPEKKAQMAVAARYAAKQPKSKK